MEEKMRYVILGVGLVSILFWGSILHASAGISSRPDVEKNIRTLKETNSCPGCDLSDVVFHRSELAGANLEGANLAGAQFNLANLAGANFKNANLQGASFGGADLAGADLTGADLTGAVMEGAYLAGVKMDSGVVVRDLQVEQDVLAENEEVLEQAGEKPEKLQIASQDMVTEKKEMQRASSPSIEVESGDASVLNTNEPETNVPEQHVPDPMPTISKKLNVMDEVMVTQEDNPPIETATIPETSIQEKVQENHPVESATEVVVAAAETEEVRKENPVPETVVSASIMREEMSTPEEGAPNEVKVDPDAEKKKQLVEKLLDNNRCVACDLSGVDLSDRDLEDADLERVILRGANLREIDLEGANLKGADLRGTDLRDADLREADLYRADISGADLTGAKLEGALVDSLIANDSIGVNFEGAIGSELQGPFIQ